MFLFLRTLTRNYFEQGSEKSGRRVCVYKTFTASSRLMALKVFKKFLFFIRCTFGRSSLHRFAPAIVCRNKKGLWKCCLRVDRKVGFKCAHIFLIIFSFLREKSLAISPQQSSELLGCSVISRLGQGSRLKRPWKSPAKANQNKFITWKKYIYI